MIKAKQLPSFLILFFCGLLTRFMRWKFNKLVINNIPVKPGHSILLLCNHFGFWDGVFAIYLAFNGLHKKVPMNGFYVMSVEKQLQKNLWMRWLGSFSIASGPVKIKESLDYAANLLNTPGNILLFYPQGNLESSHIREIVFQDGINLLIPRIKGDCQLIWCSTLTEYFESLKPSVYFNLLDCGTNHDYDFNRLVTSVNTFHKDALGSLVRLENQEVRTKSQD